MVCLAVGIYRNCFNIISSNFTLCSRSSPGSTLSELESMKTIISAFKYVSVFQKTLEIIANGVPKVVDLLGNRAEPFLVFMKNLGSKAVGKVSDAFRVGVALIY